MKYQKGDKIVLREDLVVGGLYGICEWVEAMQELLDLPYLTIKDDNYLALYTVEGTEYAITDEMISHKYEEEPKYVWYFGERGATYFLNQESLIKVSSHHHLRKVLNGGVEEALLTEEEAKKSIFYHFGMLNKHTPPPKEKLYYVCISGSVGNMYLNLFLVDDTYYFGSKKGTPDHRTKFTEKEANKIIGNSTVLYKKEVE